MQSWKNCLPNSDTLFWRGGDFILYLLGFISFFGIAILIIFYFNTDWWILAVGLGYVFLFLFIICKKVEEED